MESLQEVQPTAEQIKNSDRAQRLYGLDAFTNVVPAGTDKPVVNRRLWLAQGSTKYVTVNADGTLTISADAYIDDIDAFLYEVAKARIEELDKFAARVGGTDTPLQQKTTTSLNFLTTAIKLRQLVLYYHDLYARNQHNYSFSPKEQRVETYKAGVLANLHCDHLKALWTLEESEKIMRELPPHDVFFAHRLQ